MKVSVIVPVFNSEKYIAKCIESILAQTYADWELILVDDGSTDNSLRIIREYESKDNRIRVFCQNHAGAGMARNLGIKNATGEYIVFVDSDDTIESNYFMLLSHSETDLVFIDANQVDGSHRLIKSEKISNYRNRTKDVILRSQMTGKIPWGGCRKAVKKELIEKNNIFFTSHTVGEEAIYSFLALWFANDYSFIDTPVYNYVQRNDSLSRILLDDPWGDVAIALKKKLTELKIYEEFASTINAFIVTAAAVSIDRMAFKYPRNVYYHKAISRIDRMKKDLDCNYRIDYRNMMSKAMMLSPFLLHGCVELLYCISRLWTIRRKKAT